MKDNIKLNLISNIEALKKSIQRIDEIFDDCQSINFDRRIDKSNLILLEALTSRYARTVDILINKVFRSIDAAEFENPGSLIDTVNRAEARGIIDFVDSLRELKDLRNRVSHEYVEDDLIELFTLILNKIPNLKNYCFSANNYCARFEK